MSNLCQNNTLIKKTIATMLVEFAQVLAIGL